MDDCQISVDKCADQIEDSPNNIETNLKTKNNIIDKKTSELKHNEIKESTTTTTLVRRIVTNGTTNNTTEEKNGCLLYTSPSPRDRG